VRVGGVCCEWFKHRVALVCVFMLLICTVALICVLCAGWNGVVQLSSLSEYLP
jgi:hypothetical protein